MKEINNKNGNSNRRKNRSRTKHPVQCPQLWKKSSEREQRATDTGQRKGETRRCNQCKHSAVLTKTVTVALLETLVRPTELKKKNKPSKTRGRKAAKGEKTTLTGQKKKTVPENLDGKSTHPHHHPPPSILDP